MESIRAMIGDKTSLVKGELRNSAGLSFAFLENGSIFTITHNGILLNQVVGSPVDGGLGNLYIRHRSPEGVSYFPLLGPASDSRFAIGERGASWAGAGDGLEYSCRLHVAAEQTMWFWTVHVHNASSEVQVVDVVLTQDLGLAYPAAVRANELYTGQYIDHTTYNTPEYGYVVCSRQNQKQDAVFPWIIHGCLEGAAGYLTDGFQFYGLDYKKTNISASLVADGFPNLRYQYELALPSLKTAPARLGSGDALDLTFFAVYEADHPDATSERDLDRIQTAGREFERLHEEADLHTAASPKPKSSSIFDAGLVFDGQDLTPGDLDRLFSPERRHIELQDGKLLSFFYGPEYHVVLADKELLCERPHGHILRSGDPLLPDENILSSTSWIYGVFVSHLAIGNTNFNTLLTISRSPLNVLKSSGLRIFVKTPAGYELLGLPSAFEMRLNSARWIYKSAAATIEVKVWTSMREPACFLDIEVEGSEDLEFLISHNVVLGGTEYDAGGVVRIDEQGKRVELTPATGSLMAERYPEARFLIAATRPDAIDNIGGDGMLFADGRDRGSAYVVFKTRAVKHAGLVLTGDVLSGKRAAERADTYAKSTNDWHAARRDSEAFWRKLLKNPKLRSAPEDDHIARLNDTLAWYGQNALVHLSTPYGLEQHSGAAWGLRDVCQGPVEFLLATRNFDSVKSLLKKVYAHQLRDGGDWPQWFMLDRYQDIHAPDSHADIIVWPMKAICDYVEATNDLALLDEEIGFAGGEATEGEEQAASVFSHTLLQIEAIEARCISGTALAAYGHGDWEDSLQPVDPAARQRWVSPWTVELIYQTFGRYAEVCARAGKRDTCERLTTFRRRIRDDFNHYLVKDGVTVGLVDFGPEGVQYLLHPDDQRTGVRYRLLPMTRGIISGIFTEQQMRDHLAIINDHLTFPDGVRLMDRPVRYHGGTETLFKRAESAANFGREIGLQYVHAHIRYVEAMTKLGRADDAFRGLLTIMPIGIEEVVPSALRRQSNAYFSSSDAAFSDRYEASENFDRLRESQVGVKAGWRIYSSGPGMYIAQLILNVLGLREHFSDVLLDPVLPRELDGLTFEFEYEGRPVLYTYHVTAQGYSPHRVAVNGTDIEEIRYSENPYRTGGVLISKADFIGRLDRGHNRVEISV